jgi:hypothetical protein
MVASLISDLPAFSAAVRMSSYSCWKSALDSRIRTSRTYTSGDQWAGVCVEVSRREGRSLEAVYERGFGRE